MIVLQPRVAFSQSLLKGWWKSQSLLKEPHPANPYWKFCMKTILAEQVIIQPILAERVVPVLEDREALP